MRRVGVLAVAACATLLPACESRRTPRGKPDVVLVTIDTLRADRLGRGFTPTLDGLAAEGTRFTHAYTVSPLTLPAHTTLMTGVLPPVHGMRENGMVFRNDRPTLATTFRSAGYRTAAFVAAYVLNRRFGLDAGFDDYDDERRRPGPTDRLEASRPADEVIRSVETWVDQHRRDEAPWFLWVHLYDPHKPYVPPRAWRQKTQSDYDGEVAFADSQVGRLLEVLSTARADRDHVVAVTADHGEGLGQHGEPTHGLLLHNATVHVPLIVQVPGGSPRTIERAVSLVDVAPTLLAAAGVAPADAMPRADLLRGQVHAPAYAETLITRVLGGAPLFAATEDRWKAVVGDGRELYDLLADPGEHHSVASANGQIVRRLENRLALLRDQSDVDGQRPVIGPELQSLGYISGTTVPRPEGPRSSREVLRAYTSYEHVYWLLEQKRTLEARDRLFALMRRYPDALMFPQRLAETLNALGEHEVAARQCAEALKLWPGDVTLRYQLGRALEGQGQRHAALRTYEAVTRSDPYYAPAFRAAGRLLLESGRRDDAGRVLARAEELDPQEVTVPAPPAHGEQAGSR